MRFATVYIIGIAVVSTSASLFARLTVPACYLTCEAEANLGDCSDIDTTCLCNNPTFISEVQVCVERTCDSADLAEAADIGEAACLEVGVTLTAPAPATATPTPTTDSAPSTQTGAISQVTIFGLTLSASETPTSGSTPSTNSGVTLSAGATATSGSFPSTISGLKAAAVHDANLNNFIRLAAIGLVALAIN